jgi:hypothetical protein
MSATRSRTRRPLRGAVALALGALVTVLLPVGAATAAKPAGSIIFDISNSTTVPDTPGSQGLVYVAKDENFTATLTFLDKRGVPTPLSNTEDVEVALSYQTGDSSTPFPSTATLPAGAFTLTTPPLMIGEPLANAVLQASATTRQGTTTVGTSAPFDVLIASVPVQGATSVGGDSLGVPGDCNPTADRPVCGDLLPPANDFKDPGYLSQGCLTNTLCEENASYVQVLSSFNDPGDGTDPAPATLRMNCDKTLCGGGGIKRQGLLVTLTPGSDPVTAEACPAKGVVGPGQKFCVDYVQSTRDIAGDTILYLLFTEDAKVRFS